MIRPTRGWHLVVTLGLLSLAACGGGDGGGTGPGNDGDGNGDGGGPTGSNPPTAPSGLAITEVDDLGVELAWTDESSDETGFEVRRSSDGGDSFQTVTTTSAGVSTFEDETVEPRAAYAYTVRAVGAGGTSASSNEVRVRIPESPEVAAEEVAVLLDELLPPGDLPFDDRDLVGELREVAPTIADLPDVAAVWVNETATMQIVLTSGLSIVFPHNRMPSATDLSAPTLPASRPVGPARSVPGARGAKVVAIGGGDATAIHMANILNAGGYDIQTTGGTVEDFKQFRNLGALYIDSHSGDYMEVTRIEVDEDGEVTDMGLGAAKFSIVTETVVSAGDLGEYREELENGDLVIAIGTNFEDLLPNRFRQVKLAVTESFIRRYWRFDDGLVVLHVCFGGSGPFVPGECYGTCPPDAPTLDPEAVREAILDVGASVVMSFDNWTWASQSRPSTEYFFDRLVGANMVAPMVQPERRPFELSAVHSEMETRGLMSFPKDDYEVNITFDTRDAEAAIVGAPTIEALIPIDDADQADGQLTIFGKLGDTPGTVTVGGQVAGIQTWGNEFLEARVPFGVVGDVVVEAPGGLKSNPVPLTEWRGGVTYTLEPGQGSLEAKAEIDMRFRADVHRSRTTPEGTPEPQISAVYSSPETFGRVTGTGSYDNQGVVTRWKGDREFELLGKERIDAGQINFNDNVFGGGATLNEADGTVQLCIHLVGLVDVEVTDMSGSSEFVIPALFPPSALFDSAYDLLYCLDLTMDANYRIPGGMRTLTQGDATFTLEWTTFEPTYAPTEDTKG